MAECAGGFCNPALDEANPPTFHMPTTTSSAYRSTSIEIQEQYPDSVLQHLCANFTSNSSDQAAGTEMGHNSLLLAVNIYYGLIYIVGMCGNSLVLYVVCRYSKMHTVTNFFILSLALADLCFLINVPFLMVTAFKNKWIFGDFYCKIFLTMTTVNQFASSFFLLVMSADRYFAVCHPIKSNKYRTAKAAIVVCSIIWMTSVILMIPVFIFAGISDNPNNPDDVCGIHWPGGQYVDGMQAFTLYCLVLGFAFPLVLIVTFYTMVVRRLGTLGPKTVNGDQTDARKKSHRKVTVMVLAVVTAYLICWLPYWIAQVVLVYSNVLMPNDPPGSSAPPRNNFTLPELCARHRMQGGAPIDDPEWEYRSSIVVHIMAFLQGLCYTNSAVNPMLYALLSENFKKSFYAVCCARRGAPDPLSAPEPSVYQRSRNFAGSVRRKIMGEVDHDDEGYDEEDNVDTTLTDESGRKGNSTTSTSFLQVSSVVKNGSVRSTVSARSANSSRKSGHKHTAVPREHEDAL